MARNTQKSKKDILEDKKQKMDELKEQTLALEKKLSESNKEVEKERIESLVCINDDELLKITSEQAEEFMQIGTTVNNFECPVCNMINRVQVKFEENPNVGTAIITQTEVGFAYLVKRIPDLTDEELIKRVNLLNKDIKESRVKATAEMQLALKMFDFVLRKMK